MNDVFFNFSLEHWPALLLSLIPALANIGIFLYLLFFIKKSPLSSSFLLLLFFLFMWQLDETMMRLSATEATARVWNQLFTVCSGFVTAAGLHFVLFLTGRQKIAQTFLCQFLLYVPNFLVILLFVSELSYSKFVHTKNWGWMYEPENISAKLGLLWSLLQGLLMVVLLALQLFKLRNSRSIQLKQIKLLMLGLGIPALFANFFQGIIPMVYHIEPIPLASALLLFFTITSLIAITRFDLFNFSSTHEWKRIVENMNEGMLIVDNQNTIQYVNPTFCKMTGFTKNELINKNMQSTIWSHLKSGNIDTVADRRRNLFRDRFEMELRKKDGSVLICEINTQPYLDSSNKVIGSVDMHTDITVRKNSLKKLKESETRYRSLVEQATDGILIIDKTGKYLDVNTRAHEMLGYTRAEMLKLSLVDTLFEDDPIQNPSNLSNVLNGETVTSIRRLKKNNGSSILVEGSTKLLPDGTILCTLRDIAERKRTEEELLEKVQEMDAFIYRASHDLRGPLASIAGLTTIGKSEIKNRKALFYLEKIQDSVARLDDILIELSKIARVTQAKIEPEEINIKITIQEILANLRLLPNYFRIEFQTDIQAQSIVSDRALFNIILQNLLVNAITFMDESKLRSFVKISVRKLNEKSEIVITDNGTGMPSDVREKVFEMFYRGSALSKGSGLGLYVVKNALKKLNGSIVLSGKEGEGVIITMMIPCLLINK